VLRSGGRVALAVWDAAERNPWLTIPLAVLGEYGLSVPAPPGAPGPLALADRQLLRTMLEDAGFTEINGAAVDISRDAPDFDSWWATHLDLSASTRTSFEQADEAQTEAIEAELAARLEPYADAGGALSVPGRTLVAVAEA
jgi:hypothetical protein